MMPDLAVPKAYDAYGHPNDAWTQGVAGFKVTSSGTAAGTIVNPGAQDPTGTTNIAPPNCVSDAYGQFSVTPKGTQTTTGNLRTIYFQNPYPMIRPVLVAMTLATSGAASGGTLTITMTTTSLTIKVGTKLASSGAVTNISYVIL
jgi:hypothetical protein